MLASINETIECPQCKSTTLTTIYNTKIIRTLLGQKDYKTEVNHYCKVCNHSGNFSRPTFDKNKNNSSCRRIDIEVSLKDKSSLKNIENILELKSNSLTNLTPETITEGEYALLMILNLFPYIADNLKEVKERNL